MSTNDMGNGMLLFENAAEKELLMYQAVVELVEEDYDINSIKVSDITGRAGIGKGTAYEYFSSKEEIIIKALLYNTYVNIRKVERVLKQELTFQEKYYRLLDFLERYLHQTKAVGSLLKMLMGSYDVKDNFKTELDKLHQGGACPLNYVEKMIDGYMSQGLQEGVFTEENKIIRRSIFASQITGYVYCIMNGYYKGGMTKEEARDLSYNGIIKLLNS